MEDDDRIPNTELVGILVSLNDRNNQQGVIRCIADFALDSVVVDLNPNGGDSFDDFIITDMTRILIVHPELLVFRVGYVKVLEGEFQGETAVLIHRCGPGGIAVIILKDGTLVCEDCTYFGFYRN